MIFGRQPIFWLGLIGSIILLIVNTFIGEGILTPDALGTVSNILEVSIPLIAGLIGRLLVTPVSSPVLSAGTEVTTPDGNPAQVVRSTDT